ncbi:preprotein translocase subunit SecE [Candidatus Uhrbacteria bacterium CG10_big_fil_rev_8_21_14_0_10_50_16]|uniref:Protein translocase subunit SecE n=1 Tax=Candidatus Uhrbacteria bacterium CG10_big_fil_rev_8_21_14_0_10_50_16 TaxID=1975039 RepID=A0A2H0RM53_9BACT|nr:MAG: preprotein translocase subunit SecE [Candidatus Uhrbacteria bacterium CG10_big_fil_rev_8_21_14_0_10_50_16]
MTQTKNLVARLRDYVRDSIEESKKITWPTRKETMRYSALVIGITLLVAAFFGVLDYIFTLLLQVLI